MNIKNLLEDYGTTQKHIRNRYNISKALVSRWANISVPVDKYKEIKEHLLAKASDFLNKYS